MSTLKILGIEKRYGKALAGVLADLVAKGNGIIEISETLSMSPETVRKSLDYVGLVEAARKKFSHGQSRANRQGRRGTYQCEFQGVSAAVSRHCKRLGISDASVYRLIWAGVEPKQALTQVYDRKRAAQGR